MVKYSSKLLFTLPFLALFDNIPLCIVCFVKKPPGSLCLSSNAFLLGACYPPIIKGDLKEGTPKLCRRDTLFHAILSSRYVPLLIGSSASPILSR